VNDPARLVRLLGVPVSRWEEIWTALSTVGWAVSGKNIVHDDVLRACAVDTAAREHDARVRKSRSLAGKAAGRVHKERAAVRAGAEPATLSNAPVVVQQTGNQMVPSHDEHLVQHLIQQTGNQMIPMAEKSATYDTPIHAHVCASDPDPDLSLKIGSGSKPKTETPDPDLTASATPPSVFSISGEAAPVGDLESEILRTVAEFHRCQEREPLPSEITSFRRGLNRMTGGKKPAEIRRRVDRFFSLECAQDDDTAWIFKNPDKPGEKREPKIDFLVVPRVWESLGSGKSKLRSIPKAAASHVGGTFHAVTEKASDRQTGDLTDSLKKILS
jgi:hypothetical protein